jgi:hypothetical protein
MKTLLKLREQILDHPDEGVVSLDMADKYLQMYEQVAERLVLPEEHSYAQPVIDEFKGDPKGFSLWLQELRNDMPKSSSRTLVNTLYRKVATRALQRERRHREELALTKAITLGIISGEYQERLHYTRTLILDWGKRRTQVLDEARRQVKNPHLSLEEQEEILTAFWLEIENEIAQGDLPKP